jgi:hypothetical protein
MAWMLIFALLASSSCAFSHPNIVYYEPELPLEYAPAIHPYAWAHRLPEPHYEKHQTASATLRDFASFLELQTHVSSKSAQADLLPSKPSLLEVDSTQIFDAISNGIRKLGNMGLSDDDNNPGKMDLPPLDAWDSPFKYATAQRTGTFGIGNPLRLAVYGVRRRRQPSAFGMSLNINNPFRTANNAWRTPDDMMFPKGKWSSFGAGAPPTEFGPIGSGRDAYYSPLGAGAFPPPSGDSFVPSRGNYFGGDMFMPRYHPQFGGPSPFIPGEHTYWDVYNGGYQNYKEIKTI